MDGRTRSPESTPSVVPSGCGLARAQSVRQEKHISTCPGEQVRRCWRDRNPGWSGQRPSGEATRPAPRKDKDRGIRPTGIRRSPPWNRCGESRMAGTQSSRRFPGATPQSKKAPMGFHQGHCVQPVRWWAKVVSNHRPPACKAGALPLSYSPDAGAASFCAVALV